MIAASPAGAARRWHRRLGLVLALPLLLWAATGIVFELKPGYGAAYAALEVPALPQAGRLVVDLEPGWLEARVLRSPLGQHLLVRTAAGWRHLDAATRRPWPRPDDRSLEPLIEAALRRDPARFGSLARTAHGVFVTSTGVEVTLDWDRLRLTQRGRDTALIDGLYRLHYLQWTGVRAVDRVLGAVGPLALVALSGLGLGIAWRGGARP